MGLRERLTGGEVSLTPAEEKIAQVLLNDWPGAGLGTASSLARRAGVSDPTVNRLVVKLGFEGFAGFQARLMGEVEDRLRSPLSMMDRRPGPGPAGPAAAYLGSAAAALDEATAASRQEVHDRAAQLVMEARQVLLLGGRFSGFVAGILARHLEQFRPGISLIETLSPRELDRLVDLGRRDLVVAFDFRRYQHDVVRFIAQAAATGARVVLFTDRWQSPATAHADVVFVSPVEVASPYDTMVPLLAQVEALVAQILATQGEALRARIERIEDVRRANRVTEDD